MSPVYWMHETSGKMKYIVQKFLNDESLNEEELKTFQWYIHQFVFDMPLRPDILEINEIFKMNQSKLKIYLDHLLTKWGIDPI